MQQNYIQQGEQKKKQSDLLYKYGYFLSMLLCMMLASVKPHIGKTNGNYDEIIMHKVTVVFQFN